MRIGELAQEIGVSTDTVRYYERAGWLPRPARHDNNYREYGPADVEHLRLLIDLRRLDVPLEIAADMAGWCHSGHCADTTASLPATIASRRADLADRIDRLRVLDARLADLEAHLAGRRTELTVISGAGPCCAAAGSVLGVAEGACPCCAPAEGSH